MRQRTPRVGLDRPVASPPGARACALSENLRRVLKQMGVPPDLPQSNRIALNPMSRCALSRPAGSDGRQGCSAFLLVRPMVLSICRHRQVFTTALPGCLRKAAPLLCLPSFPLSYRFRCSPRVSNNRPMRPFQHCSPALAFVAVPSNSTFVKPTVFSHELCILRFFIVRGQRPQYWRLPFIVGRRSAMVTSHSVTPSASDSVPVTEHERLKPVCITTPSGKTVLDFGQNIAGYTEFTVNARAGQSIRLRFGEMLLRCQCFALPLTYCAKPGYRSSSRFHTQEISVCETHRCEWGRLDSRRSSTAAQFLQLLRYGRNDSGAQRGQLLYKNFALRSSASVLSSPRRP